MPKSGAKPKGKSWFKRQTIMERVLLALVPCLIGAVYFFGWRSFVMLLWVMAVGCLTEYLMASKRGDPLTGSCLVTGALLALSLPPATPFWMAAVGIIVGIFFGKEVFGGFGRNVFNPAIVGRAFIYVCFPVELTGQFTPAYGGFPGGLAHWGPMRMFEGMDALTAATPMWARRDHGVVTELSDLFFGTIGGTFNEGTQVLAAGSVGEVSALLVLLGGIYLLWTKTANWRLVAGSLGGAAATCLFFRHALGAEGVPPLLWTLSSGAMLYACFFMVTDPVSAPKDRRAQWIYAVFIGAMIVFLRWKSVFSGAVAFAILLGNTLGPTVEMITSSKSKGKSKGKGKTTTKDATGKASDKSSDTAKAAG